MCILYYKLSHTFLLKQQRHKAKMITRYGFPPKEINSTKSGAVAMSCNGQPQLFVSISEPTARVSLQQEGTWLLSKINRHPLTMLLGASADPMVLKVHLQTQSTSIIWLLIKMQFLRSYPTPTESKCLGRVSAISVLLNPLVDSNACSSLKTTC